MIWVRNVVETLTGFKYIGDQITKYEKTGENEFLIGYEESYGYMLGDYVRDKDAVTASLILTEMAAWYAVQGMTLFDALNALYEKYGFYGEKTHNLVMPGLDGLANGVSAISATTVLVIALIGGQFQVAVVMAALVGACVGFLPYNLNPAKMFMGDTGATFLGFILSTMSIQGLFKFYAVISFAVPFLILGLPIFDTAFAMIRRMAHGQSPMHADRGHIHHRLIDMGLNQKQAVATLYVISGILGLSAVVLTTGGEAKAMLLLIALCVVAVVAARVVFPKEVKEELHEELEELTELGHHEEKDKQKEDGSHE